jgi:hypothetical protein
VWYSVAQEILAAAGDSLEVNAVPAAGYLPVICRLDLGPSDAVFKLEYLSPFDAVPALQFWPDPDSGQAAAFPMTSIPGAYQVTLPVGGEYSGTVVVRALDTATAPFLFSAGLTANRVDTLLPYERVNAVDGSVYLDLDSVRENGRVSLSTCAYLPVRTGLDTRAHQLGDAVSVSSYPLGVFSSALVVVTYSDQDLESAVAPFDLEETARLYAWDDPGRQWTLVGGAVDTAQNFVSASITGPGVYAAFTTDQAVDVQDDHGGVITPQDYELAQNHPNPFNASTTISYHLPQAGLVNLSVHNILGQTVRTLVDAVRAAGRHSVIWDGRTTSGEEAGSGVYFYTLRSRDFVLTRRMVLLK